MSRNVAARWLFDPIVSVGFPMPKIAFLPVIILWLGVYDLSKIAMVVLDAIFPVVTATIAGIAASSATSSGRRATWAPASASSLWQVVLPAALPQIITGLQVALPIALIVAIVAEMMMGGYGLGGAMVHGLALRRLARRVRRHRRNRASSGYVLVKAMALAAPPSADLASGGAGAEHGVIMLQPIQRR